MMIPAIITPKETATAVLLGPKSSKLAARVPVQAPVPGTGMPTKSISATKVYEDDRILAFRDIAPQAPTHILVIPKQHLSGVNDVTAENSAVVAHIFEVIPQVAKAEGLEGGYRVVSNCGADAGQTVPHLHFHILGGKALDLKMA